MPKNIYTCDHCGREYERYPSQVRGETNYCSVECKHRAQRKKVECDVCGEEKSVTKQEYAEKDYFLCSDKCKSKKMRGEGNPNWEGGSDRYRGPEWYEMRRKRKERDSHKCVLCKKSEDEADRALEVHHVRPFKEFDMPENANHIDNLLTLCAGCHRMIERQDSF